MVLCERQIKAFPWGYWAELLQFQHFLSTWTMLHWMGDSSHLSHCVEKNKSSNKRGHRGVYDCNCLQAKTTLYLFIIVSILLYCSFRINKLTSLCSFPINPLGRMCGTGSQNVKTWKEEEPMMAGEIKPALLTNLFPRESSIMVKYMGKFWISLHVKHNSFLQKKKEHL